MERKPKLLMVEDDDLNLKVYSYILVKNFQLLLCENDTQFFDALDKDNYDLFVIDLSLGFGKDGISLVKELRTMEKYKNTPVVVLTANVQKKDELISMEAGATKFLRKPIEKNLLIKELLDCLKTPGNPEG